MIKKYLPEGLYAKLTIILLTVLLPMIGLMGFSLFKDLSRERGLVKRELMLIASWKAAQDEQLVHSTRAVLESLSSILKLHDFDPSGCREHYLALFDHYEQFANFGALDSEGTVFCSAGSLQKEAKASAAQWFRNALARGTFGIDRYYNGPPPDRPFVVAAEPVFGRDGAAEAVVFAVLDLDWLSRFEDNIVSDLPRGYTLTTIDEEGVVLFHHPEFHGRIGRPWNHKALFKKIRQMKRGLVEASSKNDEPYLYAFTLLESSFDDRPIHIILSCPKTKVFGHVMASFKFNLLLLGVISGAVLLAAWLGVRHFLLNPIRDLIVAIDSIESGNFAAGSVKLSYTGEIGQLATAFEQMREKLERHEADRRRFVSALQVIHEIDQAILSAGEKQRIIDGLLEKLQRVVPCTRISVAEYDPQANTGKIVALRGEAGSGLGAGKIVPMALFGEKESLVKGIPHIVRNIGKIRPLSEHLRRLQEDGVCSYIVLPLVIEGVLIGFLNVGFGKPDAVTQDYTEILKSVAGSLSIALQDFNTREEILHHRNALQKMSLRLIEVQEVERKKISLELHDEMGQFLTAIGINLAVIGKKLPGGVDPVVREKLDDAIALTERTADHVSDLSRFLRPSALDNLGLVPALHGLARSVAGRSGLRIEFEAAGFENEEISEPVSLTIYRVIQEALNNVLRHAQASSVSIRIERGPSSIFAYVADDGIGFEIDSVSSGDDQKGGVGIVGMRERITALQGTFHIHSTKRRGTRVSLEIPMADKEVL